MIRTPKAKKVLTKAEFELYLNSLPRTVGTHTAYRLKQKVVRTRKLRSKFVAEAKRQAREARGKAKARGTRASQGNERTVLKAEVFSEMLERSAGALKAAPKPTVKKKRAAPGAKKKTAKKKAAKKKRAAPGAKKKAAKKKAAKKKVAKRKEVKRPASWKASARKKTAKKRSNKAAKTRTKVARATQSPKGKVSKQRVRRGGVARRDAHVSSRTRRAQAKRDGR